MRISDWSSDVCSSDLERREVRAGTGFRKALAPPVVDVGDTREKALLLRIGPECRDDRADHIDVERRAFGGMRERHLLLEDIALRGRPALAAIVEIGRAPCRERVCQYV